MSELKVLKISPSSGTAFTIGDSGDTFTVPTGASFVATDEVKTDKISPASGTAFTLGDSGDTFTVPSGATIVNSGTATGFGGLTLTAEQATTSGQTITFSDIPAGTKMISVMLDQVSTSSNPHVGIYIGDSGGLETSGYVGGCSGILATAADSTTFSLVGFQIINSLVASNTYSGSAILRLQDSSTYTWVMQSVVGCSAGAEINHGGGMKALTGELTQLALYTNIDGFDAGAVSIQYMS